MYPGFHLPYLRHEVLKVFRDVNKIYFRGIDNQQGTISVMEKIIIKGLVYFFKVFETDGPFIFPVSLFDPIHKDVGIRLQKKDEIRGRHPLPQDLEELFVEPEFIVIQVDLSEYPVFIKKIIRNDDPVEQVHLTHCLGLLVTPEEEKDLGLKTVFLRILIKIEQERILLHILHEGLSVHFFGEHLRQTGLPHPKGAFNDNVSMHKLSRFEDLYRFKR